MQQPATAKPMLLPASIREASGHFLNWVYNDIFHADDGPKHVAAKDFITLPGFGPSVRLFYEWVPIDSGSRLTLGAAGRGQRMTSKWADTTWDRPPFSLLMRVWLDLCHKMDVITEGELIDMDEPINAARVAERPVYNDCW